MGFGGQAPNDGVLARVSFACAKSLTFAPTIAITPWICLSINGVESLVQSRHGRTARGRLPGTTGGGVRLGSATLGPVRTQWRRTTLRVLWMGCSFLVLLYSVAVLTHVAGMGTIGVRCMFGTKLEEEIPADYDWRFERPRIGDSLLAIGGFDIREKSYSDYIRAFRSLSDQIGKTINVRWRDQNTGEIHTASVLVQRPLLDLLPVIRLVSPRAADLRDRGRVFWKRPEDASARVFFAVCITTVGAFMGGYHWTEIVIDPLLIYLFALFAVFVPVVNLHFFLVFPRANPVLVRHGWWVLGALYGISTAYLGALWGSMLRVRWLASSSRGRADAAAALQVVRGLALGYIALATCLFAVCIFCQGTATARREPAANATRFAGSCRQR